MTIFINDLFKGISMATKLVTVIITAVIVLGCSGALKMEDYAYNALVITALLNIVVSCMAYGYMKINCIK